MAARPVFSSHRCVGGWDARTTDVSASNTLVDLGSIDGPRLALLRNQKERTCVFRNVCFDGQTRNSQMGSWVYFARSDEFRSAPKRVHANVDIWARGNFGNTDRISVDHHFELSRAAVPSSADGSTSWLETPTLVKVAALAPSNLGHFLGNGLYPAFVAAWRLFGDDAARSMPLQLLFAGHNQTDPSAMHARCMRWARQQQRGTSAAPTSLGARATAYCAAHAALVAKFVRHLLPGVSDAPLLWEESLGAELRRRSRRQLCVRQLVVGTGDLGFSTVHRLANTTFRRRPPQPLWGVFIEHVLRRIDRAADNATAPAGNAASLSTEASLSRLSALRSSRQPSQAALALAAMMGRDAASATASAQPEHAVLVVKRGRRTLLSEGYAALQTTMGQVLGSGATSLRVAALDAATMPLTTQLALVRNAAVGVTPDGGASFILAFLPRGGALVVLGALERWLWANDGRLRAFYCQPRRRDAQLPCSPPGAEAIALRQQVTADCYHVASILPCVEAMLARALEHVRLTWDRISGGAAVEQALAKFVPAPESAEPPPPIASTARWRGGSAPPPQRKQRRKDERRVARAEGRMQRAESRAAAAAAAAAAASTTTPSEEADADEAFSTDVEVVD